MTVPNGIYRDVLQISIDRSGATPEEIHSQLKDKTLPEIYAICRLLTAQGWLRESRRGSRVVYHRVTREAKTAQLRAREQRRKQRREERVKAFEEALKKPVRVRKKTLREASIPTSYEEFLGSSYWREVRQMVFDRDNNTCVTCGAQDQLQAHHLTYEHHGREKEHLGDLVTLCRACHQAQHEVSDEGM